MGIYPLNAALNAVGLLHIGLQRSKGADAHDDVLTCATEIRNSVEKLKDPRLIEDIVADFAKILSQTAWSRGGRDPARESWLTMNITRTWVQGYSGMNHG